jgi:guanylate kinase
MENRLEHMAEFRSVLENYKPSAAARETLKGMKLVLLTAPTAGGRNTIINKLVETGNYHFIVSDTTRHKRVNNGVPEQDGREYWFRTEEAILSDLKHGAFLEAEIIHGQQVSGISMRELERAKQMHKIAIDEVDIRGIANVMPTKPDTTGILVVPPTFEEWLRRVASRGHMDPAERRRRFESAAEIYNMAGRGDHVVIINDDLARAVEMVDRLARFGELDEAQQTRGRQLAAELFKKTRQYLKQES